MEIKIKNNQNIYRTNLSPQYVQKNVYFSNNSLKNDMFEKSNVAFKGLNPEEILTPFKKFGIAEYKKLIPEQIKALRASLSEELIEDRNAAIAFSNIIKQTLEKNYPNGFVFVSIGGSPKIIGECLAKQGIEVKDCPISNLGHMRRNKESAISDLAEYKVQKYKEYLNSIGLSKEQVKKSEKTFVFTDYSNGSSLNFFKQLLERPEIGINSENVCYKSLIYDIAIDGNNSNYWKPFEFENKKYKIGNIHNDYFDNSKFKSKYFPQWKLPYEELDQVQEIVSQPDVIPTKQMQFALIDYFAQKGLLKE